MDFSKPKIRPAAARPKPISPCKKHPKHRQSPGVCSLCLNEKLSKVANHGLSRGSKAIYSCPSSSYASSLSSSNASSYSSPIGRYEKSSARFFENAPHGQDSFKKSRSMAFVWRRSKDGEIHKGCKQTESKRGVLDGANIRR
ncbi:zinc ion binding [Striga asiatica]|uniref:Zinc ion binding n=1 Tax=Striga asiatica TaxID=4170 RepID=A0A5A7P3I6_STRAF|nr:zinc ion binding [Striga asiatica]